MRFAISALVLLAAVCLGALQAQAKSCSSFAVIKSYDAEKSMVKVEYAKGKVRKFFPRPSGTPTDTTKIPKKCARRVTKTTELQVKASGGRLTMTQVRSNFEGKMLNDADDANWLSAKLGELIEKQTEVVIVVRQGMGKKAPLGITTLYLPITEQEKAEIKRIEAQAEDV